MNIKDPRIKFFIKNYQLYIVITVGILILALFNRPLAGLAIIIFIAGTVILKLG